MLSVLNNRTYRHLFTAQVIALVGTGLMTVALGLLAYELAGADAGAVLGTALAIKMLAYAGVAPVAQAFADRLPRRSLLVALDLVRAAVALCLPFVTEVCRAPVQERLQHPKPSLHLACLRQKQSSAGALARSVGCNAPRGHGSHPLWTAPW